MVKSAVGAFIQAVQEGGERLPQAARVVRALRRAIHSGALPPSARLPSARQLARDWKISRGAVDEAFAQLQLEGLLQRRVGDGSYVSSAAVETAAPRQPRLSTQPLLLGLQQMRPSVPVPRSSQPPQLPHLRAISVPSARREGTRESRLPLLLHPRAMPLSLFPVDAWRRLIAQAHDDGHRALLGGGPPGGLPALREAITRHLALARGVACTPEQVLVTSGPREGLAAIVSQLLQRQDQVAIEDPTHPSLPLLFGILGARVAAVPVDGQGFNVDALLAHAGNARAVYLHPLSQYPLGARTSVARGQALLDWAERSGSWIIEGHYNDEWVSRAQQPPTLFGRDKAGRVLLLGTFEGVMFPSLRVGYLVLPKALASAFIATHAGQGERVPLGAQWAVAQFIDSGLMSEHLQRVRTELGLRRTLIKDLLDQTLPPAVQCGPMDTGAQLSLHWPASPSRLDTVFVQRLRSEGLWGEALSPMAAPGKLNNGLVLGYAGWPMPQVLDALRQVASLLGELLAPGAAEGAT